MKTLIKHTIGLCNTCKEEVPASIYNRDGKVIIEKNCPEHGVSSGLAETDPDTFTSLEAIETREHYEYFHNLTIPVTYRCNLSCKFCFMPNENEDISIDAFKEVIKLFPGKYISLSGGEPTMREDLTKLIKLVCKNGLQAVLITNGLKLARIDYLKSLIDAGLTAVFFSLDSFHPGFYEQMKTAKKQWEIKQKALANLKQLKLPTVLSSTIYKGYNDAELKNLLDYALINKDFVHEIRIRSTQHLGKYDKGVESMFLSELIEKMAEQIGVSKKLLLNNFQKSMKFEYYQYCLVPTVYYRIVNGKVKVLNLTVKRYDQIRKSALGRWWLKKLNVQKHYFRLISWPTYENVTYDGLCYAGVGHLNNGKAENFCKAVIMNETL